MPTESRSSNTEMVSVPPYIGMEPLVGRYYPAECRRCGWVGSSEELTEDDAQCTRHVGDHLCLGDCDELERHDLLTIIQAMAQPTQHQGELAQCEAMAAMVEEREWAEHVGTGPVSSRVEAAFTQLHNELSEARQLSDTLRAQLAEMVSAFRSINFGPAHAVRAQDDDDPCYPQRKQWIEWLLGLCDAASIESSAPTAQQRQALKDEDRLGIERLPAEPEAKP